MAFNPFQDADGSSLENGNPIVNIPKKATQAVSAAAAAQAKAAQKTFVDQLYGNITPSADASADPDAAAQTVQSQAAGSMGANAPAANPAEQSQLDETRKKLQALQSQHNQGYFGQTFGEEAQKKRQAREEEERQLKLQEEEEARAKAEEEKQAMDESMQALQAPGKGNGRMSQPISVTQAKTKTEINRGTSG